MKKNNILTIISLMAILIAIISLVKTPKLVIKESTFESIMKKDKITVCYIVWPPSVIKDPNTGQLSGFIIDIFNEIAKDSNLGVNYMESTWGGFTADLNTGRCDTAIAGIYPTVGRSTSVSFTTPFFFAGNSAIVRSNDKRFKSIEDLNREDIKIAVIQGEYGHIYAQKYLPMAKLLVLDKSSDNTMPLVAVSSGQADVGMIMSDTISEYVKIHKEVRDLFADKPYSTTPIAWATRTQDQELLNFLDNALSYMKYTGFLDATAKKYKPIGWYTVKQEYSPLS